MGRQFIDRAQSAQKGEEAWSLRTRNSESQDSSLNRSICSLSLSLCLLSLSSALFSSLLCYNYNFDLSLACIFYYLFIYFFGGFGRMAAKAHLFTGLPLPPTAASSSCSNTSHTLCVAAKTTPLTTSFFAGGGSSSLLPLHFALSSDTQT